MRGAVGSPERVVVCRISRWWVIFFDYVCVLGVMFVWVVGTEFVLWDDICWVYCHYLFIFVFVVCLLV